jgi:hypothetical protein
MSKPKYFPRQAFSLDFNAYRCFFFIGFSTFLLIASALFFLYWSPKYPVLAKLESEPGPVIIKAPQSGFLKFYKSLSNEIISQGQDLMRIDKFRQRLFSNYYLQKRNMLENNLKKLQQEIDYQRMRLKRLQTVLKHQAISEDFYHQQLASLDLLLGEYKQNQSKLNELRHGQSALIQAPISGKLTHLYVKNHSMVTKDKQILVIQPFDMHWVVQVQVPVSYKLMLNKGAIFNFCLPSESKIKRYDLKAKFLEMNPKVKHHDNHSYITVKAQLLNLGAYQSHLISGMPLQGYLVGQSKPLFRWLWYFMGFSQG